MTSRDCMFCKIAAGEAPAQVVYLWQDAIAIRPLNPVCEGHILVIPKRHVEHALEDPDTTGLAFRRAALLGTYPCNLITSVGAEATQTVMHLHVHIVPRRAGDRLLLPWSVQP